MPSNKKKKRVSLSEKEKAVKTRRVKKEAPVEARSVTPPEDRAIHQVIPYLLGALSLFLFICLISKDLTGMIGTGLRFLFYGIFGCAAFVLPLLLAVLAVYWRRELKKNGLKFFVIFQGLFFLFLSAMIHLWTRGSLSFDVGAFWNGGQALSGSGVVGGLIGVALYQLTGAVGAHIIGISAMLVFGLFMFGLTPYSIYVYVAYYLHERKERKLAEAEQMRNEERVITKPRPEEEEPVHSRVVRDPIDRHRFEPDIEVSYETKKEKKRLPQDEADSVPVREDLDLEEDEEEILDASPENDEEPPFDMAVPIRSEGGKLKRREPLNENEKVDLESIFTDASGMDVLTRFVEEQKQKELDKQRQSTGGEDTLAVTRTPAVENEKEEAPAVKEYEFPPITLLRRDNSPQNIDISEELHSNASKLVETLRSFKVRTHIVNVSRGPAITRYELAPEEGVRVRAIANLVDDIALNLATTGVRIEAPIPGKAAVGIEVPNKSVSTVYLRELVDTDTFRKATSKLNVCLGVDVAGDPVFLDIAKMPHLLIAGATGMGKSVCINSIITSLLYKSSSDEVKLILIDPKKVELNIYNGLPHLLVPVVSDPKKAAGSLQWAVTEMERRFEMIEEVGVRDIKNYNLITKDDPEKEFLPQVVIIIDELADLMMTAPDDVEASICRLAQKARAAGMHLILGTQRPSVDVITGLIKANIPSRIAFTVSSQTDSRVILDAAGAEKLIGRGDMLYAPVSASKPRRVQGAFVSESEVENIVTFIKEHNGQRAEYDSAIIDSIDRAAAACGNGKKGASASEGEIDGEADPMLRAAIELALECNKISTSLIQRRLSLGYGRAAKLIDEMEKRGFVSAPEGQKPRSVLITKQQYMEMVLDRGEEL